MAGRHKRILPAVAGQVMRNVQAALGETKDVCQFNCEQASIGHLREGEHLAPIPYVSVR